MIEDIKIGEEKWVLKRTTSNNWMNENNIKTHLNRANGEATKTIFCVPVDSKTGKAKDIFEHEDPSVKEFIKNSLGLQDEDLKAGSLFLIERSVVLSGEQREFDKTTPVDLLDLLIIKSNKVVATEADAKSRPDVEYVLVCEEERIKKDVKRRNLKAEGYELLKKLDADEMENILVALGYSTSGMSKLGIEDAIGKEVESAPERIVSTYKLPHFAGIVFIRKAIHFKILKTIGGSIFYGENLLGIDISDAARYVIDPANKLTIETIKKEIVAARKVK